jgi:hypothetical protein
MPGADRTDSSTQVPVVRRAWVPIIIRGHQLSSHSPGTQGTPGVVIWGPSCVMSWCEGKLD